MVLNSLTINKIVFAMVLMDKLRIAGNSWKERGLNHQRCFNHESWMVSVPIKKGAEKAQETQLLCETTGETKISLSHGMHMKKSSK